MGNCLAPENSVPRNPSNVSLEKNSNGSGDSQSMRHSANLVPVAGEPVINAIGAGGDGPNNNNNNNNADSTNKPQTNSLTVVKTEELNAPNSPRLGPSTGGESATVGKWNNNNNNNSSENGNVRTARAGGGSDLELEGIGLVAMPGPAHRTNSRRQSPLTPNGTTNERERSSAGSPEIAIGVDPAEKPRPMSLSQRISSLTKNGTLMFRTSSNNQILKSTNSSSKLVGNGSTLSNPDRRASRVTKHNVEHPHVRDVVTHVLGQKKDQDRAVCVPELLPDVLYCGVFDGHGRNGETRSELATTRVPQLVKERLTLALDEAEKKGEPRVLKEGDIHEALDWTYERFHEELDAMYEEDILKPAKQQRESQLQEFARNQGWEHIDTTGTADNIRLPQDGGTTATSVVVSADFVVIGWVGDSRAVLCRRIAKKRNVLNRFSSRLKVMTLTEDHNVAANDDAELNRVAEQGGEIYGKHIAGAQVEGMLQLTRSLGDSPFHRTGLVTSKPGMVTVPLVDSNADPLLFALVASDGLWDYFTNKEATSFVFRRLKKEGYADEKDPELRTNIMLETARAIENEAVRRAAERRGHSDDITVLLVTFSEGWRMEEENAPNF